MRLVTALGAVRNRIATCPPSEQLTALQRDIQTFDTALRRSRRVDSDTLDSGIDLIGRAEAASEGCGPASALDRALVLVARNAAAQ